MPARRTYTVIANMDLDHSIDCRDAICQPLKKSIAGERGAGCLYQYPVSDRRDLRGLSLERLRGGLGGKIQNPGPPLRGGCEIGQWR